MKKSYQKNQGFTVLELLTVVAIIILIASIAIPLYQKYVTETKWIKAIADVAGLKIAIEHCLSENNAMLEDCDAIVDLKQYGITTSIAENSDHNVIALLPNQAAIQITGKAPLGYCILNISPAFTEGVKTITWHYKITSGSNAINTEECLTFVKGSEL